MHCAYHLLYDVWQVSFAFHMTILNFVWIGEVTKDDDDADDDDSGAAPLRFTITALALALTDSLPPPPLSRGRFMGNDNLSDGAACGVVDVSALICFSRMVIAPSAPNRRAWRQISTSSLPSSSWSLYIISRWPERPSSRRSAGQVSPIDWPWALYQSQRKDRRQPRHWHLLCRLLLRRDIEALDCHRQIAKMSPKLTEGPAMHQPFNHEHLAVIIFMFMIMDIIMFIIMLSSCSRSSTSSSYSSSYCLS